MAARGARDYLPRVCTMVERRVHCCGIQRVISYPPAPLPNLPYCSLADLSCHAPPSSSTALPATRHAQTDAPVKPQTWLRQLAQAHDNVFAAVAQQASAAHAQQAQQAHAAGTGDAGAFSPRLAPLVVATVEAEPEPETSAPAAPAGPLPDLDEHLAKAQGVLAELHSTAKHTAEVVLTLRSQEGVALPRGVTALLTQVRRYCPRTRALEPSIARSARLPTRPRAD